MSLGHVASLYQGWHDKTPHSEQLLCHLIYCLIILFQNQSPKSGYQQGQTFVWVPREDAFSTLAASGSAWVLGLWL